MRRLQRVVFWAQPFPPILLLAWAVIAPGVYGPQGDSGYGALFLLVASPVILLAMLAPTVIAWSVRRVRRARATSVPHTVSTVTLWVAGALMPLFFGSETDVPTGPSIAEHWGLAAPVSPVVGVVLVGIEVLAWLGTVVFAGWDPGGRARSGVDQDPVPA